MRIKRDTFHGLKRDIYEKGKELCFNGGTDHEENGHLLKKGEHM